MELIRHASLEGGRMRHGFFTRNGGVSGGIYATLNCGYGSDDASEAVTENRAHVTRALDQAGAALCTVYQIHSAEAVTLTAPWQHGDAPKADAMATALPGVVIGVLAADCAPILLADEKAGVIGAAHAGWRGALNGIVEACVEAMVGLGAARPTIKAVVGPCIAQASYEVGPEFPAPFREADAANATFFEPAPRAGHHLFDLPGYVEARLTALGLGAVSVTGQDTCADSARFFSYRRSCHEGAPDYGRNISAIVLTG